MYSEIPLAVYMPPAVSLSLALAENSLTAPDPVPGLPLLAYRIYTAALLETRSQQALAMVVNV